MKKTFTAILTSVILVSAVFLFARFLFTLSSPTDGFISVSSTPSGADVSLDESTVGKTSYKGENLKTGQYKLNLTTKFASSSATFLAGREVSWSTQVSIGSNLLTVVNVDFGPESLFSSTEVVTLRKGTTGVSVASSPSSATISLDGKKLGQSPLNKEVKAGVHRLEVSKEGFVSRQLDINIPAGYQTVVQLKLATNPLEKTLGRITTSNNLSLYSLSTKETSLLEKPSRWAEGVWFFQERSSDIETKLDALIDTAGKTYYFDEKSFREKLAASQPINVGYLNESSTTLTAQAQKAWEALAPAAKIVQVEILSTPTGTLNVREGPSQSNKILTTIKPGEKYDLTGEQSGWYKIKVGGVEGWISSQYAKKI